MSEAERLARTLRRLALWCVVLLVAISTLSAFLRVTRAGLGCERWPLCYGQALAAQQRGEPEPRAEGSAVALARLAHRVAASAALVLILLMLALALSMRPRAWRSAALAALLLVLALALAVLGRWSSAARIPAVTIGNLIGGFLMIALAWQLARTPARAGRVHGSTGLRTAAGAAVVLLLLQIALGGLVSAGYAGLACPDLWRCETHGLSWRALDPFVEPRLGEPGGGNVDGALLQQAHRLGAVLVALLLLPLSLAAWRHGARRAAAVVVVLFVVQAALGAGLVALGLPVPLALAHNLAGAILLGAAFELGMR